MSLTNTLFITTLISHINLITGSNHQLWLWCRICIDFLPYSCTVTPKGRCLPVGMFKCWTTRSVPSLRVSKQRTGNLWPTQLPGIWWAGPVRPAHLWFVTAPLESVSALHLTTYIPDQEKEEHRKSCGSCWAYSVRFFLNRVAHSYGSVIFSVTYAMHVQLIWPMNHFLHELNTNFDMSVTSIDGQCKGLHMLRFPIKNRNLFPKRFDCACHVRHSGVLSGHLPRQRLSWYLFADFLDY